MEACTFCLVAKFKVSNVRISNEITERLEDMTMMKVKKINLFLCLTMHHTMKTYWGSGGTAPRFLNLVTRWR
jgi:hypothetical protein